MVLKMYVTLIPVIFAGVFNMIFVKLPILKKLSYPIDFNYVLKDGKRLFGKNKTFKGALGMILGGIIFFVLWGILLNSLNLNEYNYFYMNRENTVMYNVFLGFLEGLIYIIFELPNSFIKRRVDIKPGKVSDGKFKYLFVFYDQADSLIGCVLIVSLFYPLSLSIFLLFVALGAGTHILINCILFELSLRKNRF